MDNQNQDSLIAGSKIIRMPSLKRGRDDVPLDDRVNKLISIYFFLCC